MQRLIEGQQFTQGRLGLRAVERCEVAIERDAGDALQIEKCWRKQGRAAADDLETAAGGCTLSRRAERLDLVWCAFADDAALVEHNDAVGQRIGLFKVMSGEQNSLAAGSKRSDLRPHAAT